MLGFLWLFNNANNEDEEDYLIYDNDYEDQYQEIYRLLNIDDTEKLLRSENINLNLGNIIDDIASGQGNYVAEQLTSILRDQLVGEILFNRNLMLQIVIVVLLGSIFVNLANSFGTGFVSENGFYITYLIITSMLLLSFVGTIDMATDAIERVLTMIKIIVPLYAMAMNFVGQGIASVGMYEVVMVGIWLVQVIILRFIIPMIKFYVIISMVNNLNQEDSFSKLSTLVMNAVNWVLKTIVYFIVGLNLIKGLVEPQIDALGRNTVNRVATLLPGGGIVNALTGTFLGAGVVVKNSIGVGGIVILLTVVLAPIFKLLIIMLTVRITSAMIQPIGEKRYVEGIETLARGNQLLLQALFSSAVLFMLTIAIVAYSAKGI